MDMILNAVEVFFLFLAECVYDIASLIYGLIIAISESNYFSQEVIQKFASRVYVLLGIFMLFKVSFSLINYIVNPDDFTDKQKGVGKLVPNVMITLVLIVFTPRIFAELTDLQHLITGQHFFERIIFGQTYNETITGDVGDMMSLNLFNAFYYYDAGNLPADAEGITECINGTCRYDSYFNAFNTYSPYNAYSGIWSGKAEYHELLSLLAAIVLALVLIQFCFDIAIRTIKFGFLQLIAPVPIVSRIDPKSAKDGMFAKWVKLCSKTYLDLFMRLIALYFAIALIAIIYDPANETQINANMIGFDAFLVKAFLMIGVLMFAKQLPKMLEDLFGFKLDGGFTLNPIKRIEKDAAGGKFITGAVGGFAQGAIGAATGAGAGSLITGTLGGAFRNKGMADAWSKGKASNKKMRAAIQEGSTFAERMRSRVDIAIGIPTMAERYEDDIKHIDEDIKEIDNRIKPDKDAMADRKALADKIKAMEDRAVQKIQNDEAGEVSINYKSLLNHAEQLREDLRQGRGGVTAEDVAQAEHAANYYLNNIGKEDYMDNVAGIRTGARAYDDGHGNSVAAQAGYIQTDAAMVGQYNDIRSMTHSLNNSQYTNDNGTFTVDETVDIADAHAMHGFQGALNGANVYTQRTVISPADADKQALEQRKAAMFEDQRVARANDSAVK